MKVSEKRGRNGWIKFSIHHLVLKEIETFYKAPKNENASYIYNNTNIINTNKSQPTEIKSEPENLNPSQSTNWEIDYSPLTQYGFKKSHITKLSKVDGLTSEMVQESIYHYAWALDNSFEEMKQKYDSRFEKNPLGLLIGTLNKGHEWIEAGYKSPEEIAEEQILQAKRQRLERIKKEKAERFNLEFELWYEELTREQRLEVENTFDAPAKSMPERMLKEGFQQYFKKNVYEG